MKGISLTSDFNILSHDDMVFIDKTPYLLQLAKTGISQKQRYFFSRPRRFGKSVLISMLASLFRDGRKHFEHTYLGQQLDSSPDGWTTDSFRKRPVIQLDFSLLSVNKGFNEKEYNSKLLDLVCLIHWLAIGASLYYF
jgi:Predicted AAA-ATPase